jgi:hypothetical protein
MKVAIITHYYNSKNYGGNLQAYALCKALRKMSVDAEQISFDRYANRKKAKITFKKIIKNVLLIMSKFIYRDAYKNIRLRNQCFDQFNRTIIPHSQTIYDSNNISECVDNYDIFITGSDQVWHPIAYCPEYGLEFVPSNKIKLSYAASLAVNEITSEYQNVLKKCLADFRAISVRESSSIDLLKDIVKTEIYVSIDPVFLLSQNDWNEVCSDFSYRNPYVFCYFLGDNDNSRIVAEKYATEHNLKILTLPHLLGKYRKCDKNFGDEKLYDISPADFLALVKGAQIVFTDSFHAAVFSIIYEKEFVVFERDTIGVSKDMKTRLTCLLDMFDLSERFSVLVGEKAVRHIEKLSKIDFSLVAMKLEVLKNESLEYLKEYVLKNNYEN